MKIGFGCDHTAINLKKELMEYMTEKGYECVDYGAYDASVRVDYPDQGQKVAEAIIAGEVEKGVLICGTGIGMSIAANKVKGAYAALVTDYYSAQRARLSNDANISCMGAFTTGVKEREFMTTEFLTNEFVPGCGSQPKVDAFVHYDEER